MATPTDSPQSTPTDNPPPTPTPTPGHIDQGPTVIHPEVVAPPTTDIPVAGPSTLLGPTDAAPDAPGSPIRSKWETAHATLRLALELASTSGMPAPLKAVASAVLVLVTNFEVRFP